MSVAIERLFVAVTTARDSDPTESRTAQLLLSGQANMAKNLAEEAVEVVIDALHGQPEAVIQESADLLYNLVVLWVAAGVKPVDVWNEMARRERLFGIAEKLPKAMPKVAPASATHLTKQPRRKSRVAESASDTMFTTHSIQIGGRGIHVRLEDEFWDCLRDIAADQNTTLAALLKRIAAKSDPKADGRQFASVLHVYVLEHVMQAAHK